MTTEEFLLEENDWVPNNPDLPVIIYRRALSQGPTEEAALAMEAMFARNGWPPQWRNGVFGYHHFHSAAHEALGVAAGWAQLILGGPGRLPVKVEAGDVLVLPAGAGHCRIEQSADFLVVGAYPPGQEFDICRSAPSSEARSRIAALGVPNSDPVEGSRGVLTRAWREGR